MNDLATDLANRDKMIQHLREEAANQEKINDALQSPTTQSENNFRRSCRRLQKLLQSY